MNTDKPIELLPAYLEVWQIFRRRKGRIVLAILLGLAVGAGFCVLAGPRYDSTTQLFVIKKRLDTQPLTGPDQVRAPDDYLSTHMLLITSRRVIAQAIEKGELQNLKQFQDKDGVRQQLSDWATRTLLGVQPEVGPEDRLTNAIIEAAGRHP